MNTEKLQLFYSFFTVGSGIAMALSMVLIRLTLDRRVRKALPADKIYDSYMDWYFGFGRAITFGWCCVMDYVNKSERVKYHYDDMDIRAFANRFETLISYSMAISVFNLVCICIPVFYISKWLGIFVWAE